MRVEAFKTLEAKPAAEAGHGTASLPEKPTVFVEAGRYGGRDDLRSLWSYRELLYFLTLRDIKVRYKQTALGAAWAIIQPLFAMLIFTIFFSRLGGIDSRGIPYPLFAYSGVLLWTFFANAVTNSSDSLIGNASLITKVYFPRMIIPAAAVAAGLLDFAIASVILVALLLYYGVGLSWGLALAPLFVLLTVLLALGVGMWTSGLNVKYRDVRYALPFLIQLWLFLSPIIYPSTIIPQNWRWLLALNPLTGIIEGFRASLFAQSVDWPMVAIAAALTVVQIIYANYAFRRVEKTFADVI